MRLTRLLGIGELHGSVALAFAGGVSAVEGAVLLVLDRRAVRTPERLVLAGLIATTDAAFDPPAADHVEERDLLGEPRGRVE